MNNVRGLLQWRYANDGGAHDALIFYNMASTGDSSAFGELVQERFDFMGGMGNLDQFRGGYKQTLIQFINIKILEIQTNSANK